MPPILASALLALFAAASLFVGAVLPVFRTRFFEHRLSLLIGFSAGLMLSTALHELLPEAMEHDGSRAMFGVAFGFLVLYVAERMTHFHACRHRLCEVEDETPLADSVSHLASPRPHSHSHSHSRTDAMASVGMSIHNFADGLTTSAALAVSKPVGMVVLLAIVLHQGAAGMSLSSIMVRAGRLRRRVLTTTAVVASFIVWGALFYYAIPAASGWQGMILGVAGGSFLYVASCDLLPEAHAQDESWSITAMTLAGYGFALLVKYAFGGD